MKRFVNLKKALHQHSMKAMFGVKLFWYLRQRVFCSERFCACIGETVRKFQIYLFAKTFYIYLQQIIQHAVQSAHSCTWLKVVPLGCDFWADRKIEIIELIQAWARCCMFKSCPQACANGISGHSSPMTTALHKSFYNVIFFRNRATCRIGKSLFHLHTRISK